MAKNLSKSKLLIFIMISTLILAIISVAAFASETSVESKGQIDVYLIAGQSNAVGYGEGLSLSDERFTNGFDNVLYYGEGEHWDGDDNKPPLEFVPVKVGLGQNSGYNSSTSARSGAEIGIASALADNGKMNAVIKCAWGGTSIYNSTAEVSLTRGTWTSPTYIKNHNISTDGNKCGHMYTWFLETVSHGLEMLEADGYTPVIKGVWWMQGEAETAGENPSNAYNELLTDLINDMRSDLTVVTGIDQSALPFVMGEITRNPNSSQPAYIDVVCKAQLDVAAALDNVFVVDTTGLAQQDAWHYTADAQVTIGERFVNVVLSASGDIPTAYGVVPKDKLYADDGITKIPLAMFRDGKYLASYSDWNTAMTEANKLLAGKAENAVKVEVVLIDNFTAGKFDNTSQMGGTLVIDLNGYTLTTGSDDHLLNGIGKRYNAANEMCDTNIIFENGNISMSEKVITAFGVWSQYYASEKTFSYTFNNINFGFNKASASVLIAGSANNTTSDTDATKTMYVDMEFNGCTFDLSSNAKSGANLFRFGESLSNIIQTVRINGGVIINDACAKGSLYSVGDNDSVTFGKYNGHYTTLELPSGVAPAAQDFAATDTSILGSLIFAKTGSKTVNEVSKDIYELTCLKTKYGDIPATLASIEDYPFILFKFNAGVLEGVEGYSMPIGLNATNKYGAYNYAKNYLASNEWSAENGYEGQKSAIIFQRRDYTYQATEHYANYAQARGEITFDLNGYKLSQSTASGAQPIFRLSSKGWGIDGMADGHADIFPTTINVINGNIETFSKPVMLLQMSPSGSPYQKIEEKIFTINFNDIVFSLADGATTTSLLAGYWNTGSVSDYDPTPKAPFFTNLNDCTIDISKNIPAKNFVLFDISPNATTNLHRYICHTVTVNGGIIKSRFWDDYITVSSTGTYGSTLKFGRSENTGEYTKLLVPTIEEYPSYLKTLDSVGGKPLTFTLTNTESTLNIYTLGESVLDKYGYIPHRYSDETNYPYVVIVYDKNGNITQIEGFGKLIGTNNTGAFNSAKNGIQDNVWSSETGYKGQMTAVILARRDYTLASNEVFANIAQIRGEVTLDLNGYTLAQASTAKANPLFFITSKPWGTVFPSTINIINGKMLTYNGAMFKLSMWTGTSTEGIDGKLFTFNLENLTLGLCEGANVTSFLIDYGTSNIENAWVGNEKIAPFFFNLTDCVIDLETVAPVSDISLFNISPNASVKNYISSTVTVNGCEIKCKSVDNINFVTEAQNASSVTFVKDENGSYTCLTVLMDSTAPAITVNEGTLTFVKIADSETVATYTLMPAAAVNLDFKPKMSITLGSELVYNIYVPVADYLKSFTVDGNVVECKEIFTLDDGNSYYRIEVSLPAKEAARNIILKATVTVDGKDYTGSWTMSIPKYAAAL
ncbi:MAG: hypothetical protein IJD79_00180, partial [Clostridia bacterium]|nr:hypothetical protein [Clostridia bacterium]